MLAERKIEILNFKKIPLKKHQVTIDINEPQIGVAAPPNHLELEKAYEEIMSGQTEREVGVTFLTNRDGQYIPAFAVTGTESSVDDFPIDYHRELFERLTQDSGFDTLVFFHSHPERTLPAFSSEDKTVFHSFVNHTRHTSTSDNSRTRIYFGVRANSSGEYTWLGAHIFGKPDLRTVDGRLIDAVEPKKITNK